MAQGTVVHYQALLKAATVSYGADPRAEDVQGNTPAHLAAAKGHLAILTALLQVTPTFVRCATSSFCSLHTNTHTPYNPTSVCYAQSAHPNHHTATFC